MDIGAHASSTVQLRKTVSYHQGRLCQYYQSQIHQTLSELHHQIPSNTIRTIPSNAKYEIPSKSYLDHQVRVPYCIWHRKRDAGNRKEIEMLKLPRDSSGPLPVTVTPSVPKRAKQLLMVVTTSRRWARNFSKVDEATSSPQRVSKDEGSE